jgi:hypothetical protein
MKVRFFLLLIAINFSLMAQKVDTIRLQQLNDLESQIDSLRYTIKVMGDELDELRQNIYEGQSNLNEILAIFDENSVESSDFDSRSKRKRVDALLTAITQQPGQLRLNGSVTSVLQGANACDGWRYYGTGSFDIFAHTSFGKGSLLFIDLEAIGGDGPEQHYNSFSGVNGDAGNTQSFDSLDRVTVLEAWGEFTLFKESVTITAGKIDLTNYFDNNASANDETTQFLSGSFINSSAFAAPPNSPGIRLRTTIIQRYHLQFALSSYDNAGVDLFNDLYKIASLGWTFSPGSDFEANIRLYGYQHPYDKNAYGWGISIDKILFGSYNIFGRYGQNQNELSNIWNVKTAWSAGTRFVKSIAGQLLAIGIAYGENSSFNEKLNREKLLEIYFRRQLNRWVDISPLFQYFWNAKGSNLQMSVFGIRTHFNF